MFKALILAARPKTLCLSVIPVFVGIALASNLVSINIALAVFTTLTSLCIQIATNFINDGEDFKRGADTNERKGPQRAVQSGLLTYEQVRRAGIFFFSLALVFAIPLMVKGALPLVIVVIASLISGYLYTAAPSPLAYYGLGEVFVILFFGLVATCATYYVQTLTLDYPPLLAGFQTGMLASVLIAINNLRDIDEDYSANKRTLAVRFGQTFALIEIALLATFPLAIGVLWLIEDQLWPFVLPWICLPFATFIIKSLGHMTPSSAMNKFLGLSAIYNVCFAICLIVGILIG